MKGVGLRPTPVVVALAIVVRGDEVLVCRRQPGEPLEGLWEFPGGKVREGEPPDEAARRECLEEVGIEIEPPEPLTFVHHDYGDMRVLLLAFIARLEGEGVAGEGAAPTPALAREARWVPLRDLGSLDMPQANAALIKALRRRLDLP